MIQALIRWLSNGKLERAKAARFRAWCAHAEAVKRGDTRLMHETRKALYRATTAKLALELAGSRTPQVGKEIPGRTEAQLQARVHDALRRGLSA